ncbi:MAG: hypothetical protein M3442_21830 [Chloroflexota bacterium]|nr:hypothetical protein [Chloroflexota bacterium]
MTLVLGACGGAGEQPAVRIDSRGAPSAGTRDGVAVAPPPAYAAPGSGYGGYYSPQTGDATARRGNTPEGAAFANWVLSTDAERKYIVDAFVRDDQVLGMIVNPNMTRGQVQQAMGSLLTAMRKTFPNRDLQVIAYYVSGDEVARTTLDSRSGKTGTTWRS